MALDFLGLFSSASVGVAAYSISRWMFQPHFCGNCRSPPPSTNPFSIKALVLGHLIRFIGVQAGEGERRLCQQARDLGGSAPVIRAGWMFRLLTNDPEDIKHLLVTRATNFHKDPRVQLLSPVLGQALVTLLDEDVHTQQRRLVNPAFGTKAIREISQRTITHHLHELLKTLKSQAVTVPKENNASADGATGLSRLFDTTALSIISEAAFMTTKFDEIEPLFREAVFIPDIFMILPHYIYLRLPLPRLRYARGIRRQLMNCIDKVLVDVRNRKDSTAATNTPEDQEGHRELEERENTTLVEYLAFSGLTDTEISDHCLTFVFAGHETTATALGWVCYMLAIHPDVQETLYEELHSAVPADSVPDAKHLGELHLPFLRAVINETMRVIPPVMLISRTPVEDDVLPSGIYVPKGSSVLISIAAAHMHPSNFPDQEDAALYRPARWIEDETLEERLSPCGFMPFAAGKRNCIGKEFALNELLLATLVIFRNLKLSWPVGQPHPEKRFNIVTKPSYDYKLKIALRESA